MNSKTRVITTLNREEPDRVPVGEWGVDHDIVRQTIGHDTFWRAKARTTKALWAGKRDEVVDSFKQDLVNFIEALGHDLVPVHLVPSSDLEPREVTQVDEETWEEQSGRVWRYSAGNDALLPIKEPSRSFESEDDLRAHFEENIVPACGFTVAGHKQDGYELSLTDESRLDLIRHIVDTWGDEKFIFARGFEEAVGSPEPLFFSELESLSLFYGIRMDEYLIPIHTQPELTRLAFDLYTELAIAMAKVFIGEGVHAIMPQGDFASNHGPMISPNSIRQIFLPGMKKLCDYGHQHGVKVLTHNCGNNWDILDILTEAGYDGWQSIQSRTAGMDLRKLKDQYGADLAFWGGINLETLHEGTADEVRKEVEESIRQAAPGGGFILGTSNSVAYGTPYDNYMAALDALNRYGAYPVEV